VAADMADDADVGAYVDVDIAGDMANDADVDNADVIMEAHFLNGPTSKVGHQFGKKNSNDSIIISIIII
jgi:hypothetical protein